MKKEQKRTKKVINILTALLLCFFCAFSFVGCMGMGYSGSSSSGSGSGGSSSGGSGSSGSGSTTTPSEPEEEVIYIDDMNDVMLGAIGVYDIDDTEEVFYDKYQNKKVSFNELKDRQFSALASYIYNSLEQIYGSRDASNIISSYGSSKSFDWASIINDSNQNAIAGLSGTLTNSSQLNYANSINGGYDLVIETAQEQVFDDQGQPVLDDLGNITYQEVYKGYYYDTATILTANAWKSSNSFNYENLKKALQYIYSNSVAVSNKSTQGLDFSTNDDLRSVYSNISMSDSSILSFDMSSIDTIGFSIDYMWNVLYFLGYSVVGENNINNSIQNYNSVFSGSTIRSFTQDYYNSTVEEAFEEYKGYNIILADIVENAFRLVINESAQLGYSDEYFTSTLDNTLYPKLKRYEYIYFDDIEDICDAEEDSFDADEDYDWDSDDDSWQYVTAGTARKLREIIYLPNINSSKYKNTTFALDGLLIGLQTVSGDVEVEVSFNAIYNNDTSATEKVSFPSDYSIVSNGNILVNSEFNLNDNLIDGSFYEEVTDKGPYALGSVQSSDTSIDVVSLITSAFTTESYTVDSTSEKMNLGVLNVYNNLIGFDTENGTTTLNLNKNIFTLTFNYYINGQLQDIAPSIYVMYLSLFD